eukprot:4329262-Alexandrium_andersonii.AAC.1
MPPRPQRLGLWRPLTPKAPRKGLLPRSGSSVARRRHQDHPEERFAPRRANCGLGAARRRAR